MVNNALSCKCMHGLIHPLLTLSLSSLWHYFARYSYLAKTLSNEEGQDTIPNQSAAWLALTTTLPSSTARTATSTCLSDPKLATRAFVYGPSLGHFPLRESIAKWLSDFMPLRQLRFPRTVSRSLAEHHKILPIFCGSSQVQIRREEYGWLHRRTFWLAPYLRMMGLLGN